MKRVRNQTVRDYVGEEGYGPLIRGFVVLFQLIRLEQKRFDYWKHELFTSYGWNARKLKFERDTPHHLKETLERLITLIHSVPGALSGKPFSRSDFVDVVNNEDFEWVESLSRDDANEEWLKWHFEQLVEAGVLLRRTDSEEEDDVKDEEDDKYILCSKSRDVGLIAVPLRLSKSADDFLPSIKEWLTQSLGFAGNHNAIGQLLYDAFVQRGAKTANEKAKKGREFLDQLLTGKGPAWLFKVLETFAEKKFEKKEEWTDRKTWPSWLRQRS